MWESISEKSFSEESGKKEHFKKQIASLRQNAAGSFEYCRGQGFRPVYASGAISFVPSARST